ncbi:UDP-3-O-(3-hydroxymyristoyl)glucosamine N-acyltransferase [Candidatus Woesearchaeota archaeon]|nr:UDP-3-O-(3-hydroxymyristoyl)glucosamine N-acyltransferase [Candidatus Woesearchaeota archaeon]
MNLLASTVLDRYHPPGILTALQGQDRSIQRIAPIEECQPGDLVFIDHPRYLATARERMPAVVVTTEALAQELATTAMTCLIAPNVRLAMALIKQTWADRDLRQVEWEPIHATAVIHASVEIPEDAVIGPGVVIGAGVRLGQGIVILANAVIEREACIGANTVLHPRCTVGYQCHIGAEVILKSGCVIGSEGFGFAQDAARHNYRIPHTGNVVIGDRVVIGANTTIDRATYGSTFIRAGAVIDALCHIGHNVDIGEDCIICAHSGISGSSRFGKRVIASGQTGVLDHVSVPDDTLLLHRAGLPNSIREPGQYAGGPVQPLQQYLKNMAVMPRLHEMWNRLKKLEKRVAAISPDR